MNIAGRRLVRAARYAELKAREGGFFDLAFVQAMPEAARLRCLSLMGASHSQLRQDLFALSMHGFKTNGFFVEFGATDGVELNNTVLMERDFGWTGILAEPARGWHDDLKANRAATIDTRCVWRASGETLRFTETPRGENSALSHVVSARRRARGTSYDVTTISLNDLLEEHGAPQRIDYMSVDTEGTEADILGALDWARWSFGVITVEHNFAPQRAELNTILTGAGYVQVLPEVSRFDDWYVDPIIAARLG